MGLWTKLKSAVLAVAAVLNITSDQVCYDSIGCFSNEDPFNNAAGKLPESPATIQTMFLLYTRGSNLIPEVISIDPLVIDASYFSADRKTKVLIHGYRADGQEDWLVDMKDALLLTEDVNVIIVDWEKGANLPSYNQAASNTRVVGAVVAQLLETLSTLRGARFGDMHIIGHSLGAQIAGYAGARTPGLGRISGLDPAGPSFSGKLAQVRLDETDALFVDVIHTDGEHLLKLGFGSLEPMGHVDFYPNGGKNQPGCPDSTGDHLFELITGSFKGFVSGIACDHSRVRDLYIESILNPTCGFTSVPCSNMDDFDSGLCTCNGACANMGYTADIGDPRGSYYLTTHAASPFCVA